MEGRSPKGAPAAGPERQRGPRSPPPPWAVRQVPVEAMRTAWQPKMGAITAVGIPWAPIDAWMCLPAGAPTPPLCLLGGGGYIVVPKKLEITKEGLDLFPATTNPPPFELGGSLPWPDTAHTFHLEFTC